MIKFFRKIRQNLLMENKTGNYFKYAIGEIVLVVIGILIALQINNWNENRKSAEIENKILIEISNGLEKDLIDVNINKKGHVLGLNAIEYWNKIINNENVNIDSIQIQYHRLLRNFISVQNTSGYESLKSRGLELVKNDSLRLEIISLYEENYSIIKKIEEEYHENKFYKNYYKEINSLISSNFIYDNNGDLESFELPLAMSEEDKKEFLSYLMKIKSGREFTISIYDNLELKIKETLKLINLEI